MARWLRQAYLYVGPKDPLGGKRLAHDTDHVLEKGDARSYTSNPRTPPSRGIQRTEKDVGRQALKPAGNPEGTRRMKSTAVFGS